MKYCAIYLDYMLFEFNPIAYETIEFWQHYIKAEIIRSLFAFCQQVRREMQIPFCYKTTYFKITGLKSCWEKLKRIMYFALKAWSKSLGKVWMLIWLKGVQRFLIWYLLCKKCELAFLDNVLYFCIKTIEDIFSVT